MFAVCLIRSSQDIYQRRNIKSRFEASSKTVEPPKPPPRIKHQLNHHESNYETFTILLYHRALDMSVLLANLEADPSHSTTTIDLSTSIWDNGEERATAYLWHAAANGAYATAV